MNFYDYKKYNNNFRYIFKFLLDNVDFYSIQNGYNDIHIKTPLFNVNHIHNNNIIDYNFINMKYDIEQELFYNFIKKLENNVFEHFYHKYKYKLAQSIKNEELTIKIQENTKIYDQYKNISSLKNISPNDSCMLCIHIKYVWINHNTKYIGINYIVNQIRFISRTIPSILDIPIPIPLSPSINSSISPSIPPPPPPPPLPPAFPLHNSLIIKKNTKKSENEPRNIMSDVFNQIKNGIKLKSVNIEENNINIKDDLINEIKNKNFKLRKTTEINNNKEFKSISLHNIDEINNIRNNLKKTSRV